MQTVNTLYFIIFQVRIFAVIVAKILPFMAIDIEYNKRLDRQRPCFEDELTGGSNNIVQSNKSV